MKKTVVLYHSKTGFTKKYAHWIADDLSCDCMPIQDITSVQADAYDIIVYGAGMHASLISGLDRFRKLTRRLTGKTLVVFATGGTPYKKEIVDDIYTRSFTTAEQGNIDFYYFQSGLNYEGMSRFDRLIMNIYSRFLLRKSKKNEVEAGTSKAILTSYDHSRREYIAPLVTWLKSIT